MDYFSMASEAIERASKNGTKASAEWRLLKEAARGERGEWSEQTRRRPNRRRLASQKDLGALVAMLNLFLPEPARISVHTPSNKQARYGKSHGIGLAIGSIPAEEAKSLSHDEIATRAIEAARRQWEKPCFVDTEWHRNQRAEKLAALTPEACDLAVTEGVERLAALQAVWGGKIDGTMKKDGRVIELSEAEYQRIGEWAAAGEAFTAPDGRTVTIDSFGALFESSNDEYFVYAYIS